MFPFQGGFPRLTHIKPGPVPMCHSSLSFTALMRVCILRVSPSWTRDSTSVHFSLSSVPGARCGLYKVLRMHLQMQTFLPCYTRLATLSEPHGGYKDHNITEQGCPNVMTAISISLPQSSDSGAFCVIGAQLSIWHGFFQAIHPIPSFLDGSGFFLFPL